MLGQTGNAAITQMTAELIEFRKNGSATNMQLSNLKQENQELNE